MIEQCWGQNDKDIRNSQPCRSVCLGECDHNKLSVLTVSALGSVVHSHSQLQTLRCIVHSLTLSNTHYANLSMNSQWNPSVGHSRSLFLFLCVCVRALGSDVTRACLNSWLWSQESDTGTFRMFLPRVYTALIWTLITYLTLKHFNSNHKHLLI